MTTTSGPEARDTARTAGPDSSGATGVEVQDAEQPTARASDLDPRLLVDDQGLRGYVTAFRRRIGAGELGSLPVVIGLVVIWAIFQSQQGSFLSAENLSNLAIQMTGVGAISIGIVFVLLLGEVDLSVGSVAGVSAAVMAVLVARQGTAQPLAVLVALVVGTGIGLVQGVFFTKLGVPSFVVTLAGLLGWQGLQLYVLGDQQTATLPPTGLLHTLTSAYYPAGTGWALAVVATAVYLAAQLWEVRSRSRAGLRPRPLVEVAVRTVVVGAVLLAAVGVLNGYKGVPLALVVFVVLVVLMDLLIRRTRFGRHVLAVGGNAEAARRAGISVTGIRLTVFALSGLFAAVGGVLLGSKLAAVNGSTGGNTTTLYAIAAAVIGGTSLFGGRGTAYSALLGILVIQSIDNGMALLSLDSSVQFMITGAVLLASVTLDSVSRRGQRATGRV